MNKLTNIAHIQLLTPNNPVRIESIYSKNGKVDNNAAKYLGGGARFIGISKGNKVLIKLGNYYKNGKFVGNYPPIAVSPNTLEFYI